MINAPTFPKPILSLKEAPILKAAKDYLAAEGFLFCRMHCGRAKRGKYWLNLCAEGTPDLLVQIPAGRPVINPDTLQREASPVARIGWIETKRQKGGRLSLEQKEFRTRCHADAALHWVVADVEELRRMIPPKFEFDFHRRG